MWPRVYLPLLALASGVLFWILQNKLIVSPFIMLVAWPFWLAMVIGIALTVRYHFVVGVAVAIPVNLVLIYVFGGLGMNPEILGYIIYSPVLPLAILQLIISPFQLRGRDVSGGAKPDFSRNGSGG